MNQFKSKPPIGKRVMATLIDYGFIFSFSFFYIMQFGEPNATGGKTINGLPAIIPVLLWFIYIVVIETYYAATPGHIIAGIKVVSIDGKKLQLMQVCKRRISDALEIIPFFWTNCIHPSKKYRKKSATWRHLGKDIGFS